MKVITKILLCFFFTTIFFSVHIKAIEEEQSIIIEVEGDPHKHRQYIEDYHPLIEVVQVYDTIFTGIALKGKASNLERMGSLHFVKKSYPVRTYQTNINRSVPFLTETDDIDTEQMKFTGKGVKVGVIDTGVDYSHPDLSANYKGGYDLVDLDDDPMETLPEQGEPTLHGTHVSGIIAASGNMKGIAPEADLYGYRALGPGGRGTSIQVIAAIEKAVKDGMDVINMSLGNTVNGPDWPTSIAVNHAVDRGVSIVIANGNSGPANWTVGSPATSPKAVSVGASTPPMKIPFLEDSFEDKRIELAPLAGSKPWDLEKEYPLIDGGLGEEELPNARGKVVIMERGIVPFSEKARKAAEAGANALIIYNNEEGILQGSLDDSQGPIDIPVAAVGKKDGQWLMDHVTEGEYWIDTTYQNIQDKIADFSSRGPVTTNWNIKPEIVAPGAAIVSTVPGGYRELQGTSMASPHVAGGLALVKQAHPDWKPEQLKGALLTTALPLKNGKGLYNPIDQGMGRMQPQAAIDTETIIYNPMLAFGKIDKLKDSQTVDVKIENVSKETKTYHFELPQNTHGLSWQLPKSFTLEPGDKKNVSIQLSVISNMMDKGLHQGWITLKAKDTSYQLPYLFINREADYPKAMGLEFALKTFSKEEYEYRIYLPEEAKSVTIDLYDPHSLVFQKTLVTLEDTEAGVIEGTLKKRNITENGEFIANVEVKTTEDKTYNYQTVLSIE
ncbi:S8 family serine peptidase [Aquibacillus rhizosphaerae]|uniref:S8 family serine peptidase n=1 Tax=Aquibacillus rhizosphaerae TaxID=3051431 RepID=A0ABT7L1S7_9BACI|nr:S8 family serine peptidase [Aquibacillus sp. LR5S19]MDL4839152.1 S8 family serine peptidase [Aquibacillus sp. LR5S19]